MPSAYFPGAEQQQRGKGAAERSESETESGSHRSERIQQSLAGAAFPIGAAPYWAPSSGNEGEQLAIAAAPRGLWISTRPLAASALARAAAEGSRSTLAARAAECSPSLILHPSNSTPSSAVPLVQTGSDPRALTLPSLRSRAHADVLGADLASCCSSQLIPCCIALSSGSDSTTGSSAYYAKAIALVPRVHFRALPIEPLRVSTSTLSFVFSESRSEQAIVGFLSLDQRRRAVLLTDRDASRSSISLVGAWIVGARSPHDFACWAIAARFALMCPKHRLQLQNNRFLFALANDSSSAFDFYEMELHACMRSVEEQFALHESNWHAIPSPQEDGRYSDFRLSALRQCTLQQALSQSDQGNDRGLQGKSGASLGVQSDVNGNALRDGTDESGFRLRDAQRTVPTPSSRRAEQQHNLSRGETNSQSLGARWTCIPSERAFNVAVNTSTDCPPIEGNDAADSAFVERSDAPPSFIASATRSLQTHQEASVQTCTSQSNQIGEKEAHRRINLSSAEPTGVEEPTCSGGDDQRSQDPQVLSHHESLSSDRTYAENCNTGANVDQDLGRELADQLERAGRQQAWENAESAMAVSKPPDSMNLAARLETSSISVQERNITSKQLEHDACIHMHDGTDGEGEREKPDKEREVEDFETTLRKARSQLEELRTYHGMTEISESAAELLDGHMNERRRPEEVSPCSQKVSRDAVQDASPKVENVSSPQDYQDECEDRVSATAMNHNCDSEGSYSWICPDSCRKIDNGDACGGWNGSNEAERNVVQPKPHESQALDDDLCDDSELQSMLKKYFHNRQELEKTLTSLNDE